MSSTYTDKNNPFHGVRISILNWKPLSQPYFNRIFSNRLSHNNPAKRWPYRFRSRGTTGSSILDHDFGHFCRGRRIQIVWTFRFCDFSIFLEHLPFWPGYKQILRPLLVLRSTRQSGNDIHDFLLLWFLMLMILVQWILHKIQNHLSQYRLGVQLDLYIFGALSPIRHSSNDRCPSVKQNELICLSSWLHGSPLFYFWLFIRSHAGIFSNFSHSLSTAAFDCGYLHCLRHRNKICVPNCNAVVNWSLFLQDGPHDILIEILSYAFLWIHWLPRFTQIWTWNHSLVLLRTSPCLLFSHVLQSMAGAIGVSNFFKHS